MTDSETVCRANDHSSACWKPSQLSLERKGRPSQISHDVTSADEANWLVSERKAAEIRVCLLGENLLYRRVLQSSQKEMEFYNCTLGGKSGFECCFSIEGLSSSHDGGQTLCHTVFELRGNALSELLNKRTWYKVLKANLSYVGWATPLEMWVCVPFWWRV